MKCAETRGMYVQVVASKSVVIFTDIDMKVATKIRDVRICIIKFIV